jgi:hypothetical protein
MMDASRADGSRADGHERDANGAGSARNGRFDDWRTLALLRGIFASVTALAQDESELLRSEVRDTAKSYVTAAAAFVAALVAVGALVNFLGLAAVAGLLEIDVPLWAAALICAAGLALIGVGAVAFGLAAIRNADPVPRRTISNIRRDFQAMRDALQERDRP